MSERWSQVACRHWGRVGGGHLTFSKVGEKSPQAVQRRSQKTLQRVKILAPFSPFAMFVSVPGWYHKRLFVLWASLCPKSCDSISRRFVLHQCLSVFSLLSQHFILRRVRLPKTELASSLLLQMMTNNLYTRGCLFLMWEKLFSLIYDSVLLYILRIYESYWQFLQPFFPKF